MASTGKCLLNLSYVFVGGRWVQEILGVGQTVGTDRAQIGQLEVVVAVPVGGRERERGERERDERRKRKKKEKEEREPKQRQEQRKKNNERERIASMHVRTCLFFLFGPVPHPMFSWCPLTIPKCTRGVVRRC